MLTCFLILMFLCRLWYLTRRYVKGTNAAKKLITLTLKDFTKGLFACILFDILVEGGFWVWWKNHLK